MKLIDSDKSFKKGFLLTSLNIFSEIIQFQLKHNHGKGYWKVWKKSISVQYLGEACMHAFYLLKANIFLGNENILIKKKRLGRLKLWYTLLFSVYDIISYSELTVNSVPKKMQL